MLLKINRDVLKTLSSDTRISILKCLSNKRLTLSELSNTLNLPKSTIHDNLMILVRAGLVKGESGSKWVYYELTEAGKILVNPHEQKKAKIMILLSSLLSFIIGTFELYSFLKAATTPPPQGIAYAPPDAASMVVGLVFILVGVYLMRKLLVLGRVNKFL